MARKQEARAALQVLQQRWDKATEAAWEGREADAGYDAGEWSGPAHDRMDEEQLAPLEYDVEAAHILVDHGQYDLVVAYAAGSATREQLYAAANRHQEQEGLGGGLANWNIGIWRAS
jgi:hypothetical protein